MPPLYLSGKKAPLCVSGLRALINSELAAANKHRLWSSRVESVPTGWLLLYLQCEDMTLSTHGGI